MTARRALQPQVTLPSDEVDDGAVPIRTDLAAGCPVGEVERLVLARVDGVRSIGDIASLLGLTTREGAMVIARLEELGAVTMSATADVDEAWEAPSGTLPTLRPKP
jgi:hypothetical protein